MLHAMRRRLERDEDGFTLIELMVVVLIIAILLAIAIPTFLGARARAQNRAAQSNLRNTLTAEKTYYTDAQKYINDANGDIKGIEPAITYGAGLAAPAVGTVNIATDTSGAIVCLTATSASGKVYVLADEATGNKPGTYYGTAAVAACDAATVEALALKWT
jgi:type IV pilus assembly protein PilA